MENLKLGLSVGNLRQADIQTAGSTARPESSGTLQACLNAGIKLRSLIVVVCAVSSLCSTNLYASEIPWKSKSFEYAVEGKDLKDVLKDFAGGESIPIVVAPNISGVVTGRFNVPPQRFLEQLAGTFNLLWYYDGMTLSVTLSSDVKSSILHLDTDGNHLRATLDRMGISDSRFPVRIDDANHMAMVLGPSHYVDLVTAVIQRVSDPRTNADPVIKIFKLTHAWAADRQVNQNGRSVTVPGLASTLRTMFRSGPAENGAPAASGEAGFPMAMHPMTGMSGGAANALSFPNLPPLPQGMNSSSITGTSRSGARGMTSNSEYGGVASNGGLGLSSGADRMEVGTKDSSINGGGTSKSETALPVIQPDAMTNSILIRDLPWKLAEYERVIKELDGRPKLIEIEVHIIEVDETALKQLGIDWSSAIGNSTSSASNSGGFESTSLGVAAAAPGAALVAMLGNEGRYFLSKINALEQANLARIDASPKVSTLDNVEAVMDNTSQFYVPVSGYASAELYSISAGVSLRVLPMIVTEDGHTDLKLDVHIDDGQVTSQTVGNLPIVSNSQITTQAFVRQGQSLLIAGYRVNSDSNGQNGVPLLSKVPLLGGLFRYESVQRSKMERIFLVSPRIVSDDRF
ncbi:type III secretion system protein [Caballeronia calidae]|uniref:Type 3 secretion system secretin n=1 Tax=Caballeronia calidae TaxID=1777139 RepID=A0A158EHB0_9BURK|nr:type III secretion system outer membrane ring subunit SctC [Caballeronia calidae]SAL06291.1 type III secretion system protein [Caballeronia calidae]